LSKRPLAQNLQQKKTAARKTTTRKPSLYDQLKKMGWGFLLKTYSPEHIQKLTETP